MASGTTASARWGRRTWGTVRAHAITLAAIAAKPSPYATIGETLTTGASRLASASIAQASAAAATQIRQARPSVGVEPSTRKLCLRIAVAVRCARNAWSGGA